MESAFKSCKSFLVFFFRGARSVFVLFVFFVLFFLNPVLQSNDNHAVSQM